MSKADDLGRPSSASGGVPRVREALAFFPHEEAFMNAIDDLERNGFDRAEISVLAESESGERALRRMGASAPRAAESDRAPRSAVVDRDSVVEAQAAAVGIPGYIGALGAFLATAATGGALAFTIPAAIAGGLAGGGLGAIGAYAIGKGHRDAMERQIGAGGVIVWVRTPTPESEERALRILEAAGGQQAHVHEVESRWDPDDRPLARTSPDPFLAKEPDAG